MLDGLPARFSVASDADESVPARGPGPLDHRPRKPTHLAFDRQPGLALAFRPWAGRHAERFRPNGEPAHRIPSCSTGWRGGFSTPAARSSRLHRLIVTSAVYRQSVRHDTSFAAIDGDNQWLWRQNRRRLDAESIHDAILAVAGQLDHTMRGPSVQQFSLRPGVHVTPVVDYTQYDWTSPGSRRRSVYRFLFRTLPDPFFDALDSADASQLIAVRNESTTPLQALELLNNPFVLRQCEQFAKCLQREHQGRLDDQVRLAIELAYGREASTR